MTDPYTAEVAAGYDAWFATPIGHAADRLELALLWRLAQPHAGERALDVGTGTGHLALALAREGLQVTGLDASPAMLVVARAKGGDVAWREGLAEALPFPDGHFDLVVSLTALEFVRDRRRALAEMVRVCRPGGRVVVATLNARSAWGRHYRRLAQAEGSLFGSSQFYAPDAFVSALAALTPGAVRWASAVFFRPTGRGLRCADALEWLGARLARSHGALLVGRIDT